MPSRASFGGLRKWDLSGLCPFPLRNMRGRKQTGGGQNVPLVGGSKTVFWGGVLDFFFLPSPEFSTPLCSSLKEGMLPPGACRTSRASTRRIVSCKGLCASSPYPQSRMCPLPHLGFRFFSLRAACQKGKSAINLSNSGKFCQIRPRAIYLC